MQILRRLLQLQTAIPHEPEIMEPRGAGHLPQAGAGAGEQLQGLRGAPAGEVLQHDQEPVPQHVHGRAGEGGGKRAQSSTEQGGTRTATRRRFGGETTQKARNGSKHAD